MMRMRARLAVVRSRELVVARKRMLLVVRRRCRRLKVVRRMGKMMTMTMMRLMRRLVG